MKQPPNQLFSSNNFPRIRMRRNRMSNFSRRLTSENNISLDDLIYPIFITYGSNIKEEVVSMPGIYRYSLDLLHKEIEYISSLGIPAIAFFPKIEDALKTCHVCILTLAVFRVGGNLVIERSTNRKDTK